ncbi:hypothetical protein [Maribellus maritimus]|uniref:hypothetical protein n=1 Tax=Maribellus maritimus TaxID=2870838 RepID=UPI001EEB0C93|nr:hypothetical protein [Maribellus maritimus]MCG6185911.1 hypothetical protein [Maribellus maritimus]
MKTAPAKNTIVKIILLAGCFSLIQCEKEPEMVHVRYINESSCNIDTFAVDNTVYFTTISAFMVNFNAGGTSEYFSFENSGFIPFNLTASSEMKKFYSSFVCGSSTSDNSSISGAGYYDLIITGLNAENASIVYTIQQK